MYLEIKVLAPFQELRYKHLIKIIKNVWIIKIFAEFKILKSEMTESKKVLRES